MSIKVDKVTKIYGVQKALDNVSFSIDTGDVVGFLGPNGAGKTTMMKIITGFMPQTSGKVFVNGMDIEENSLKVRKIIGYLPENNPLYTEMYVREYLKYVAGIYKLGKSTKSKIEEVLVQTGLLPEIGKRIGELSKGFRQRVGLAQALLHNPEVLVLDEPTSGLDPNQIVEIRELIREIGKEKTVMLSTHIMQEVEAICDKTIIINKGKIVADDRTDKIMKGSTEKKQSIFVEFNKGIDKTILLSSVKEIQKVKQLENNCWIFEVGINKDIRPKIFNFAVKNDLQVLSMQNKEKKLEDVFQELTGGK